MTFATHYDWTKDLPEIFDSTSIIDPSGYISPKQRITNLIRAGERLDQFRREMYDLSHDQEDDGIWMDEMRTPGLDYSDITQIQRKAMDRIRSRSRQDAVKPNIENEQSEAKGDVQDGPADKSKVNNEADNG